MNNDRTQKALIELARAQTALAAGFPREALALVQAVLAADPASHDARLLAARIHLAIDDARSAMQALDVLDLYDTEGRNAPARRFLRIEALARCAMDDVALPELSRVSDDYPDDPRPQRLLARVQERLGKVAEAASTMRRLLKLEPSDRALRVALAHLVEAHDPDTAIDAVTPIAQDAPSQRWLARLHKKAGRLRESADLYDALTMTDAPDADLLREAGETLVEMGDVRAAQVRLLAAVEASNRRDIQAMSALARVYMHAGDFMSAGRWWWRAARLAEKNADAWAGLTVSALAMGRWSLALRAMRPLSIHTSRTERQKLVAMMWIQAASGVAIRRTVLHEKPTLSVHHQGQLDRLLAQSAFTLEQHASQFPNRADAHYHLASCRLHLGDADGANTAVNEALRINPRYEAAHRLVRLAHDVRAAA